jgi:hypothetical protein
MASPPRKTPGRVDGIPARPKNQRITLDRAAELTHRHQKSSPASEHGGFFWADGVREMLGQPGVTGLRFYHGLDARGNYRLVLVGVDSTGRDVVKRTVGVSRSAKSATATPRDASSDAILLDGHFPCPPFCWPASPLL